MSAPPQTPGRAATPRHSGIPAPGGTRTTSGIPTPGRVRSTANTPLPTKVAAEQDTNAMHALSDAIRANNPAWHRATPELHIPPSDLSGRRSVTGRPTYSSRASTSSAMSTGPITLDKYTTPRPKTPSSATTSILRSAQTPRSSLSSRPASRQSDVFRASSRQANHPKALDLGDPVRIESLGVEGTVQFLGEADFKEGLWAGVELSAAFAGRGKNDGSVAGVRYFTCAPNCGVFVNPTKLTALRTRSDSVASGRYTPVSGRETPSFKSKQSYHGMSSNGIFKTPEAPKFAPGSRANKYIGLTARDLSISRDASARHGPVSPTRTGSSSPTRTVTSLLATPKATSRPSASGLPGPTPRRSIGGLALNTPRAVPGAARTTRARSPPPVPDLPLSAILNHPSNRPSTRGSSFAKPITPTFSQTSSDTFVEDNLSSDPVSIEGKSLEANARAIQDRIARLMSSTMDEAEITTSPSELLPSVLVVPRSTSPDQIARLQVRIAELEADLEKSKASATAHDVPGTGDPANSALAEENASLTARIATLEAENSARLDAARGEADKLTSQLREVTETLDAMRLDIDARTTKSVEQIAELESDMSKFKEENEKITLELAQSKIAKTVSDEEITGLKAKLASTTSASEADKRELAQEVDELRLAGQETIALYEERLSNAEANRYDLEDALKTLQEQLQKQAEPISKAELTARATTAAQIDNETLQEQVTHLQSRISLLEDQLHDARAAADAHEQAYAARMTRFRESEVQLKKDLETAAAEKNALTNAEAVAIARIQEISNALQESDTALEDARAEIELLRSDMAVLEAAKGPDGLPESIPAAELQAQLDEERRRRAEVTSAKAQLEQELTSLKTESDSLATKFDAAKNTSKEQLDRINEMSRLLDQRARELENARSLALSTSSRESTPKSTGPGVRNESSNLREQITGLKHVVQELTKENAMLSTSNKVLEKDNKQLTAECDQLRESLEHLEEAFEQKILQEHASVETSAEGSPLLQDVATLRQAMKDAQKRHEHEMDQMRKKLADAEMEHAKAVNKLNHDLTDLEQLLEARIYKEDELEEEIRQLKSDLRKATKGQAGLSRKNRRSTTSTSSEPATDEEVVCEACGKQGHDIATCDEVFNGLPKKSMTNGRASIGSTHEESQALWCEDCESHGHVTADCPYSQDVF